jgi:ABC-type transporter Mla subunit MlaD
MNAEIIVFLVSAVASLVAGGSYEALRRLVEHLLGRKSGAQQPPASRYSEQLERLTDQLTRSSGEVDQLLAELGQVARERQADVAKLEGDLKSLADHEQQLKRRIDDLEKVPLAVAEHFAALSATGERRSAKRDYLLFGAGVLVSTVSSIIFYLLGSK